MGALMTGKLLLWDCSSVKNYPKSEKKSLDNMEKVEKQNKNKIIPYINFTSFCIMYETEDILLLFLQDLISFQVRAVKLLLLRNVASAALTTQ